MAIGLGCMRLSTDPARDPARGRAVIAAAIDAGVTLLDTADAYALDDGELGHNERLLAESIAGLGRPVEIATKGGLVRPGGAWRTDGRARHLAAAARASRDRLGVPAIDLYFLHAVDPRTPLATSVRALAKLRDDGVVRRIGLSNVSLPQLDVALALTPIDAVEIELSPWRLDPLRGGLIAACAARDIQVLAHRPLGGPAGVRRANADPVLAQLAARLRATPCELVLAWIAALSPVIVPLPGATQVATARSAARAPSIALDDETRAALAARFLPIGDPPPRSPRPPEHGPPSAPRPPSTTSVATAVPMTEAPLAASATAPATCRSQPPQAPFAPSQHAPAIEPTTGAIWAPIPAEAPALRTLPDDLHGPRAVPDRPAAPHDLPDRPAAPHDLPDRPAAPHDLPDRGSLPEQFPGLRAVPDQLGGAHAVIVLVIGMPASGKSTLAAAYTARGYLRLNRDDLGGSLLALARRLDRELARGARHVVLDNTYPTRASRAPVLEIARRHGAAVVCLAMATSLEQAQHNAVARILARHGRLLMPAGAGAASELARAGEVDPRALFRFRRDYEPPCADEGFAAIEHVPWTACAPPGGAPGLITELDDLVWRGRPSRPEQITLRPGARDALRAWSQRGAVAATTWQPGLASTEPLAARLADLLGVPIDVVHCAHPPGPPVCWCRKPMPGLALVLARRLGLDLARTVHLGKGPADRAFAVRAGMPYVDIAAGWPQLD